MGKRILIIEPDEKFARHMVQAVHGLGQFSVLVVPNVAEATHILRQEEQDVVICLLSDIEQVLIQLRPIQPTMRLIVTVPTLGFEVPAIYTPFVQGVLPESYLEASMGSVLLYVLAQPVSDEGYGVSVRGEPTLSATAILSHGTQLLSVWGALTQSEAALVVAQVGQGWPQENRQAQIQFMQLPHHPRKQLLYTSAIQGEYLLTLASERQPALRVLRTHFQEIAQRLQKHLPQNGSLASRWFVLAWKGKRPFPSILRIPIRRALIRIAQENQYKMGPIYVGKQTIQLLVAVPPQYSGQWVAERFKRQLGQLLYQQWPSFSPSPWHSNYQIKPLTPQQVEKLQKSKA